MCKYQKHITSETAVDSGGAYPISTRSVVSSQPHRNDSGMRNRKVAIRLCIIGNNELPCPLK